MFEEKRRALRLNFSASAKIKVPGDQTPRSAKVADISRVGMGLRADLPIEPGKFTTIHVMFKDTRDNLVEWRTSGTIVHSTETAQGYVIGVNLLRPINRLNAPELHTTLERAGA